MDGEALARLHEALAALALVRVGARERLERGELRERLLHRVRVLRAAPSHMTSTVRVCQSSRNPKTHA